MRSRHASAVMSPLRSAWIAGCGASASVAAASADRFRRLGGERPARAFERKQRPVAQDAGGEAVPVLDVGVGDRARSVAEMLDRGRQRAERHAREHGA